VVVEELEGLEEVVGPEEESLGKVVQTFQADFLEQGGRMDT
jgi:hypothetical protein